MIILYELNEYPTRNDNKKKSVLNSRTGNLNVIFHRFVKATVTEFSKKPHKYLV